MTIFTCALEKADGTTLWIHVRAKDPQLAAKAAAEVYRLTAPSLVRVYRGKAVANDPTLIPEATVIIQA